MISKHANIKLRYMSRYKKVESRVPWNPLLLISDDTFKKNLTAIINRSSFHSFNEDYFATTDREQWNTNYMESELEFDRIAVAMGALYG